MKTCKEGNWHLVFKVKCPHCFCDISTDSREKVWCNICNETFRVSTKVIQVYNMMDKYLDQPYPPAAIRKNT